MCRSQDWDQRGRLNHLQTHNVPYPTISERRGKGTEACETDRRDVPPTVKDTMRSMSQWRGRMHVSGFRAKDSAKEGSLDVRRGFTGLRSDLLLVLFRAAS